MSSRAVVGAFSCFYAMVVVVVLKKKKKRELSTINMN